MPIPEVIQAIGAAVAAVVGAALTAWQTHTTLKVRDMEVRLRLVEQERDKFRKLFRVSVRHIREWMAWAMHHAPGTPPPPLPPELNDEV